MKCEYCVYYDSKNRTCTNQYSKWANQRVNPNERRKCSEYVDNGLAGAMAPDVDLFDMW